MHRAPHRRDAEVHPLRGEPALLAAPTGRHRGVGEGSALAAAWRQREDGGDAILGIPERSGSEHSKFPI